MVRLLEGVPLPGGPRRSRLAARRAHTGSQPREQSYSGFRNPGPDWYPPPSGDRRHRLCGRRDDDGACDDRCARPHWQPDIRPPGHHRQHARVAASRHGSMHVLRAHRRRPGNDRCHPAPGRGPEAGRRRGHRAQRSLGMAAGADRRSAAAVSPVCTPRHRLRGRYRARSLVTSAPRCRGP